MQNLNYQPDKKNVLFSVILLCVRKEIIDLR